MGQPSKALTIDPTGRVLITDAADNKVMTQHFTVNSSSVELKITTNPLKRRKLLITVPEGTPSGIVVYIGGDDAVDEITGYPMYRLDQLELDVDSTAEVWAMTEPGKDSGEVHIMEIE